MGTQTFRALPGTCCLFKMIGEAEPPPQAFPGRVWERQEPNSTGSEAGRYRLSVGPASLGQRNFIILANIYTTISCWDIADTRVRIGRLLAGGQLLRNRIRVFGKGVLGQNPLTDCHCERSEAISNLSGEVIASSLHSSQ